VVFRAYFRDLNFPNPINTLPISLQYPVLDNVPAIAAVSWWNFLSKGELSGDVLK
jgi:hypothetical protein